MNPRLRRLEADHRQVVEALAGHPWIELVSAEGVPPERYRFRYRLTGLVALPDGSHERGSQFEAEIVLPLDYPRRPPFCRMHTPTFHPNIDPRKICLGDHWSAGQRLVSLVVRIGEMITYQSYNVKSPLNAEAAAWAEANAADLPLLQVDLGAGV
jgi:ubiquitin-protein ligase